MLYNEGELQAAIADGERKLALKRQQRVQEKRRLVVLCVVLALLVPFCIAAGIAAAGAPSAPSLVVTWPKPKVKQVLAPGQTILARDGQPFSVQVTNPEKWDVTWKAAGIESAGLTFPWAPAEEKSTLVASCKAKTSSWMRHFAWTWPRREISLQATSARSIGNYTHALDAGSAGVWVYPHVFATGSVQFDERALPLLASGISLVPQNDLSSQLASVTDKPTPQLWQLVADFEGRSSTTPSEEVSDSTFATLHSPDIESSLPLIAGGIVKSSPDASVKFILRLDKDPAEGIIRIAFDGKQERRAWVRRAGESAGGPFTGWEDGDVTPSLPPTLPQR
jgi:hypothetical protein